MILRHRCAAGLIVTFAHEPRLRLEPSNWSIVKDTEFRAPSHLDEAISTNQGVLEELRKRLRASQEQVAAARQEVRRVGRELALASRLLRFFSAESTTARAKAPTPRTDLPVQAMLLTGKAKFHLDICEARGGRVRVAGWAFEPVAAWDGDHASVQIIFRHAKLAYVAAARRAVRPDVAVHFAAQPDVAAGGATNLDGAGFVCDVTDEGFPPGLVFEVVLRLENGGNLCEQYTGCSLLLQK